MKTSFIVSRNEQHWSLIDAVKEGVGRLGYSAVQKPVASRSSFAFSKIDLIVATGWNPQSEYAGLLKTCKEHGVPMIVISDGYMNRSVDSLPRYSSGYWAVSLNGLNSYTQNPFKHGLSDDRFAMLHREIKPWKRYGEYILVAHQHRVDWNGNPRIDVFKKIMGVAVATGRPIRVRLHPNHWKNAYNELFSQYPGTTVTQARRHSYGIDSDLEKAYCLVTHDSNAATDAVLSGVPAFALGKTIAYPVCGSSLNLADPSYPDRTDWANWAAYQQWTKDEIRTGKPFDYLLKEGIHS